MTAVAKTRSDKDKLVQLVHVAANQLALADESYRDLLYRVTGKRSSKSCTSAQLNDVMDEFKRLGWKHRRKSGRKPADNPQARKIRALWRNLWHLGEIGDPSEEALAAFVANTVDVDALQWLTIPQIDAVIKALRGWLKRKGVNRPAPARIRQIDAWRERAGLPAAPSGFADKVLLMEAQWERLKEANAFKHGFFADLGSWTHKRYGVAAPHFLSAKQADSANEALGAWLRRELAKGGGS